MRSVMGELKSDNLATDMAATDEARSQDGPAAARRRRTLAREAKKGLDLFTGTLVWRREGRPLARGQRV